MKPCLPVLECKAAISLDGGPIDVMAEEKTDIRQLISGQRGGMRAVDLTIAPSFNGFGNRRR